jgi:DNA-binding beta-propeller fold protein YncE
MFKNLKTIFILLALTSLLGCVPDKFQFTKEIGNPGSNIGELLGGTDIDITKEGHLVVADAGNNRYQIIGVDGIPLLTAGNDPNVHENYKLGSMAGIGVDKVTGEVWVCDQKENKIIRFDPQGKPNLRITKNVRRPTDVAVGKDGSIYVIMSKKSTIYKYDKNGRFVATLGGQGKGVMIYPTSIIVANEHMLITDYGGKRVLKLNLNGDFITEYSSKGDHELFIGPSCIHTDNDGNIYVLDLGEIPIVILDPDGNLISKIGEFGDAMGQFLYPTGIIAKTSDDIYILDNTKNKILNFKKKPEK